MNLRVGISEKPLDVINVHVNNKCISITEKFLQIPQKEIIQHNITLL